MFFGIIVLIVIAALGFAICAMVAVGERGLFAHKVPQLVPTFQRIYDHLEGTEEPPAMIQRGIDAAADLRAARAKQATARPKPMQQPAASAAR